MRDVNVSSFNCRLLLNKAVKHNGRRELGNECGEKAISGKEMRARWRRHPERRAR